MCRRTLARRSCPRDDRADTRPQDRSADGKGDTDWRIVAARRIAERILGWRGHRDADGESNGAPDQRAAQYAAP